MKNLPEVKGWKRSIALATVVLGGFVLFAGAGGARASDGDDHRDDRQRQYSERRVDQRERFWARETVYERDNRGRGDRRDYNRRDRDRDDRW